MGFVLNVMCHLVTVDTDKAEVSNTLFSLVVFFTNKVSQASVLSGRV